MITIFTAPAILFFVLGVSASLVNRDIQIADSLIKAMSIFLLIAIGLKGGINLLEYGLDAKLIYSLIAGFVLSAIIPIFSFAYLRIVGKLDKINAAAISAHYGSISIITFITATSILSSLGIPFDSFMIAVAAVMEAPAIITALYLAGSKTNLREVFFNDSIVFLLGALVIGTIIGSTGMAVIAPLFTDMFQGVLTLFLLAMGLKVGFNLTKTRVNISLLLFAIVFPILASLLGLLAASLIGLSAGSAILLMTLCASASYIAAPAAISVALPQANPSLYFVMSLGITFTFNILFGIPLYIELYNLIN